MGCWYKPSTNRNVVSIESLVQTIQHTGIMTEQQHSQLLALSSGWTLSEQEQAALDTLIELLYSRKIRTGCRHYLAVVA
ncbi:MAG: hypothetical protein Q6K99_00290 [Thermostichales cyanobacterium BF4_bins_65]